MLGSVKEIFLKRIFDIKVFSGVLLVIVVVFLVSDNLTQKKTKLILDEKYKLYSEKLTYDIRNLIDNKKEMTLTIALSLAQESDIKKALLLNDPSKINLQLFSKKLSEQTSFKNVWFNIVDSKGIAFYRSWIDKKGDSIVKARVDIQKMLEKPQIMSTISVGKFDMTFKSMVPIYEKGEFIGVFEIITHFNSIVKNLEKNNVGAVALVDKKYTKQLTKAFTKTFVDDYYIANLDANVELLSYMKKNGLENFFNNQSNYILDELFGKLIIFYNIPDINNQPMATIIAFKDIKAINTDDVEALKTNIIFYTVLLVIVFVLYGYYIVVRQYSRKLNEKVDSRTKELNNEKSYIQTILDTNPSIILVMKEMELLRANKSFFDFFGYETIEQFTNENRSICNFFISLNDLDLTEHKVINGRTW